MQKDVDAFLAITVTFDLFDWSYSHFTGTSRSSCVPNLVVLDLIVF